MINDQGKNIEAKQQQTDRVVKWLILLFTPTLALNIILIKIFIMQLVEIFHDMMWHEVFIVFGQVAIFVNSNSCSHYPVLFSGHAKGTHIFMKTRMRYLFQETDYLVTDLVISVISLMPFALYRRWICELKHNQEEATLGLLLQSVSRYCSYKIERLDFA